MSSAPRSLFTPRLQGIYAIVDAATTRAPLELMRELLAGGIRLVQYRNKSAIDRATVRALHGLARRGGALLVVNDDLESALEADGLHAGQEDLAGLELRALRDRLGSRVFGISCGTIAEARAAALGGADYIGVGPFAATATKGDAGSPLGERGVAEIVAASTVPVAAIGGIGPNNLTAVARTGAAMAAVVSALALAPDPRLAARELVLQWRELHA